MLAVALNDQNLVRALEILLVALIWLFFLRVARAVWVEVRPPRPQTQAAMASSPPAVAVPPTGATPAAGAPSSGRGRPLRLRTIEPEDRRGQVVDLPDEVTVGRAAGCGVCVEDAYTSSLHARLFRRDGALYVEDLGSTNGTWVNAQRVTVPTRLGRGDLLQVGGTVFEVHR